MIIKFVKENPKIPFPQANDVYKLLKYINDALEKPQKRLFKYISFSLFFKKVHPFLCLARMHTQAYQ
jgi:hypothetical protein